MDQAEHDRIFRAGFKTAREKMNKHYGTPEQYERHRAESYAASPKVASEATAIGAGDVRPWQSSEAAQFVRHDFDRADRPRECQRCLYVEHDGSGIGWHPCSVTSAASPKVASDTAPGVRFRHLKRGTVYEVIGNAELQTAHGSLVDGSALVVYRGDDGKLWAREEGEFHDGRFAALAASPTASDTDTAIPGGEALTELCKSSRDAMQLAWESVKDTWQADLADHLGHEAAASPKPDTDTPVDHHALEWTLRNPWSVAGGEPREKLPQWALDLMSRAADALDG